MSKSGQRASRADAGGQRVSDNKSSKGSSRQGNAAQPQASSDPGGKSKAKNDASPSDVQKKSRPQR